MTPLTNPGTIKTTEDNNINNNNNNDTSSLLQSSSPQQFSTICKVGSSGSLSSLQKVQVINNTTPLTNPGTTKTTEDNKSPCDNDATGGEVVAASSTVRDNITLIILCIC